MPDTIDQLRVELERELPWARAALAQLEIDGFAIHHLKRVVRGSWLLRGGIPEQLQARFGLAPELHVAIVEHLQSQDISRAYDEAARSNLRVDTDLVLVVGPSAELSARVARTPGHGQRVAWVPPFPPLARHLGQTLPRQDLYDERNPVRGAAVIGRRNERSELNRRVESGGATAVLGLRKVGKTTLTRAITDNTDGNTSVAWVDLQRVTAQDMLRATVSDLAGQLALGMPPDEVGRLPRDPIERLKALAVGAEGGDRSVCLVIDEFDLFFEGENRPPPERLRQFFGLLRGLSQDGAALAVLLLGRDPALLSTPRMGEATNPLLGWVREYWLGPMSREGANDLLFRIGRRVGIEVTAETKAVAYRETGGHPLLHRQFGSALLSVMSADGAFDSSDLVESTPFTSRALHRFQASQALRDVGAEVSALLGERYPDARDVALELAHEDPRTVWEIYDRGSETHRTLANFGLLVDDTELVPWLGWYMRRFVPSPAARQAG